jgi:hypothetical protein
MTTHLRILRLVGTSLAAAALGATVLAPVASYAGDDDELRRTGSCSAGTTWKLKAKTDDGRLEVEGEVDSNRNGQTWRWVLRHNGSVSARGTGVTAGRSGSFDVERKVADVAGTDRFVFRAVNRASGEVCRGTLTWK